MKMPVLERVPLWVWWTAGGVGAASALGYFGVTYSAGKATGVVLLRKIDGVAITGPLASRFEAMRAAAVEAGVKLKLNSAFRSYAEQVRLYLKSFMPGEPTAAKPGFSNHQSGRAVDIAVGGTSSPVYLWLANNASKFGFRRTVASEPWHWELVS